MIPQVCDKIMETVDSMGGWEPLPPQVKQKKKYTGVKGIEFRLSEFDTLSKTIKLVGERTLQYALESSFSTKNMPRLFFHIR